MPAWSEHLHAYVPPVLPWVAEPRYQVILLDTPGVITKANSGMEERMMAAVKEAVQEADAGAWLYAAEAMDARPHACSVPQP